jgi:stage IV sporulation protein FA
VKNRKAEAVKKRIAERKKETTHFKNWQLEQNLIVKDESTTIENHESNVDQFLSDNGKQIKKENMTYANWFLFRFMVSMCLVLIVAILFRSKNPSLDGFKSFVENAMKRDYQFAKISNWTNETLGDSFSFSPIAFFEKKSDSNLNDNVIPVAGKLKESFKKNGKGITVETNRDKSVKAIKAGVVIFAGYDEIHGKTIIVQQANKMNVWYGNLATIKVNLYQHVTNGEALGTVTNKGSSNYGEYYFAIEKNDKFLDPTKVISFE